MLHMHWMDRGTTFHTPFSMSPATPVAQPSVLGVFPVPCVLYSTCSKAYASLAGQALTQLFSSLTVLLNLYTSTSTQADLHSPDIVNYICMSVSAAWHIVHCRVAMKHLACNVGRCLHTTPRQMTRVSNMSSTTAVLPWFPIKIECIKVL